MRVMRVMRVGVLSVLLVAPGMALADAEGKYRVAVDLLEARDLNAAMVAAEVFRSVIVDESASVANKAEAQFFLGRAYERFGEYHQAAAAYRKVVDKYPTADADKRAFSQQCVAMSYERAGDYDRAIDAYHRLIKEFPNAADVRLSHVERLIGHRLFRLERYEDALAAFQRLTDRRSKGDDVDHAHLDHARIKIVECHLALGNVQAAAQDCLDLLSSNPSADEVETAKLLLKKVLSSGSDEDFNEVCGRLRACIGALWESPAKCDTIHSLIGEAYLDRGQIDEAMFEARILVDVCGADGMKNAGNFLARTVKAKHRDLVAVNAMFRYLQYGKAGEDGEVGTDDDLADLLAGIHCPNEAQRDQQFAGPIGALQEDWKSRLKKANLYRYWGKPEEALKELDTAFALCPLDQDTINSVTDRLVGALTQVSGDAAVGQQFVDFQQYGVAGTDGIKGTEDDLTNPIEEYIN